MKTIEKMLLGGEEGISWIESQGIDLSEIKSPPRDKEKIRKDFIAGIINKDEALKLLGYSQQEILIDKNDSLQPKYFSSDLETYDTGEIFAVNHAYGGTLAFNYQSEEEASNDFLLQNPAIEEVEISNVTDLVFDTSNLDFKTDKAGGGLIKIRGNLCRNANGKFVSCNGKVSAKTYKKSAEGKKKVAASKEIAQAFTDNKKQGTLASNRKLSATLFKHGIDDDGLKLTDSILRSPTNQKQIYNHYNNLLKTNNPELKQRERTKTARELAELFSKKYGTDAEGEKTSREFNALLFRNNIDDDGYTLANKIIDKKSSQQKIENHYFEQLRGETPDTPKPSPKPKATTKKTPTKERSPHELYENLKVDKKIKDRFKNGIVDFESPTSVVGLGKQFSDQFNVNPTETLPVRRTGKILQAKKALLTKDPTNKKLQKEFLKAEKEHYAAKQQADDKTLPEFWKLRNSLIEAHGVSNADAEKWVENLELDNTYGAVGPAAKTTLRELYRLTGGKNDTLQKVFTDPERPRAYASVFGVINMGKRFDARTLYHEFGHHVEFSNDDLMQANSSWIARRADTDRDTGLKGQKRLSEITGNSAYRDDETALTDKWVSPYIGKVYQDGATEVMSMGIEHFSTPRDMKRLYDKDPEHFNLIVGSLLKPKGYRPQSEIDDEDLTNFFS